MQWRGHKASCPAANGIAAAVSTDFSLEAYHEFLKAKTEIAKDHGYTPDLGAINPWLKPHQKTVVQWAVNGGRRAIFAAFGLGKTVMQLETIRLILEYECSKKSSLPAQPASPPSSKTSKSARKRSSTTAPPAKESGTCTDAIHRGLIVAPLGVRQEFKRDASQLGIELRFIRSMDEVLQLEFEFQAPDRPVIYLTNYETVRDGKLNPAQFTVTSLDEAAVLRGFGGTKTFREFMRVFDTVKYRFVATATPDPNDYIELLAYAAYLGIMDVSQSKTRFFKRDSTKADKLTIHPHKQREFWTWVATWALFLQRPSELGFSDEGYTVPEFEVIYHEIPVDHTQGAQPERDGQGRMFREALHGVTDAAREKRDTMTERVAKMREILDAEPDEHFLLWHDLEAERHAIKKAVPEAVCVWGSMKRRAKQGELDSQEQAIIDFADGRSKYMAGKPQMLGAGCNWQRHCARAIYVGIGYKFNDWVQSLHRILRYLQNRKVVIHMIYAESEKRVLEILLAKWERYKKQADHMSELMQTYGLSQAALIESLQRSMGIERLEISDATPESPVHREGDQWVPDYTYRLVNNDCVDETHRMADNSVDLILTSIPFCYDEQTEILTKRGWIRFSELTEDDEAATVNPKGLHFEWQHPYRVVWQHYSGEMLHFGNRCFDLLVTPNHDLWAARRGASFSPQKLQRIDAETVAKEYETTKRKGTKQGRLLRGWRMCSIPPAPGVGCWPERIDIPPLPEGIINGHGVELYWIESKKFMELIGWYLSEGHADAQTSRAFGRISIAQVTRENLRQEIAALLQSIGLPPSWHTRQLSVWCRNLAHFLTEQFGHGSHNKKIPRWVKDLHPDLLRILRDTMMKGDGGFDLRTYTSYSKQLCDDFQEICLKTGWRACVGNDHHVKVGSKQLYPEIRRAPKRIQYDGMIGCASVPNGLLIVRRNGMPCVSGNSTQYEYSPNFCDFGHTDDNEHFFRQMNFLTPQLLRVLKPGRLAAIHVKDRIVPGGITGLGFQTVYPFHAKCIEHYCSHGFAFMGMKTIVTDVVRENNQTYRLGWTEQCKDGTKMGYGMEEYLLLFRKPLSDTSNAYADVPVLKKKPQCVKPKADFMGPSTEVEIVPFEKGLPIQPGTGYSRSRWQIDAHGFARSSGNRPLMPEDLEGVSHATIFKLFRKYSLEQVYDFEHHVKLGEILEAKGILPVTFMLLQPQSWHPNVWTDITRMQTLNGAQSAKGKEMHLCPLPFDIANRVIVQNTMEGETVYDPFAGLGTVPMCAIEKKRKAIGVELSAAYFTDALTYVRAAAEKVRTPSLFDLMEAEEEAEDGETIRTDL
jgi:hypothetical protein